MINLHSKNRNYICPRTVEIFQFFKQSSNVFPTTRFFIKLWRHKRFRLYLCLPLLDFLYLLIFVWISYQYRYIYIKYHLHVFKILELYFFITFFCIIFILFVVTVYLLDILYSTKILTALYYRILQLVNQCVRRIYLMDRLVVCRFQGFNWIMPPFNY
jgi:hypothetical protein